MDNYLVWAVGSGKGVIFRHIVESPGKETLLPAGTGFLHIQLFRERLSKNVHASIPKGIEGSSEFTVLQRNLK